MCLKVIAGKVRKKSLSFLFKKRGQWVESECNIFHILKVEEKNRIDENDIVVEENVSGESEIVVRNERWVPKRER